MSDDEKLKLLWAFGHWKRIRGTRNADFDDAYELSTAIQLVQDKLAALEAENKTLTYALEAACNRVVSLEAERDAAIEMAQMRGRAAGEAEREVVRLREALEGLCQCHDLQPGCRPCYACEALEWKWDAADEK